MNSTWNTLQQENYTSYFLSISTTTSKPKPPAGNSAVITDLQKNLTMYGYILLFLFGFMVMSIVLLSFSDPLFSVAMCSSAWFLLAISVDRWLRIRYPFKVRQLCTRKRVLIGAFIVLIHAVAFNSHLLLPSLGTLPGLNTCGPMKNLNYVFFFRQVWSILLPCLQTVFPTFVLLIVTIDMFIRLRLQEKRRQQLNRGRRRAFVDRQMLIIMLTSIFFFFSTQIPLSLFNILLTPILRFQLSMTQVVQMTSILTFVSSGNYATTFYVHCLTSGLFRQEFYNTVRWCLRTRSERVGTVTQIRGNQIALTQNGLARNL
ncbi:hypothetical protein I4U23_021994 [Adineta vaga]|nr:hypothetical protein I4U23_021994 [Adineta vaga]